MPGVSTPDTKQKKSVFGILDVRTGGVITRYSIESVLLRSLRF